ncbi:MAG: ADP-glyceromanno-heptose 6-epimerase [Rhodospirillaceae bacterium]|nr:ADP-glyceromanno-heptose 6-epimerase [Rhodospirillaceae bacterium]
MIVVTGGAGFIGSNLIAGLEARGAGDIVVCDWLGTDDKWRNLAKRELRAIVPPEELLDFLDGPAARDGVEAIFHLGAISATTETDADLIARTNIALPQALWQRAAERGWRFIYASSAATYGNGEAGFDDDNALPALARLRPMNPYGWSKHAFDRFAARAAAGNAARPRQWVGLKFFNVYGPNEYHKGSMRSVVHQIHPRIAAGETAKLFKSYRKDYPDGGQMRDFIWVGDCVDVMLWLYDHPAVNGIYNCGTGQARSFADLALAVFAAAGKPSKIAYIDMPAEIRDRYQYFTEAKMERLAAVGYNKPFTALEEGVGRYVQDFLAADDPYR